MIENIVFIFSPGLCIKNLNPEEGEKFPTTIADLQGFWDMVNLQVDHIDSIFKEMEILKANNWKVIANLFVEFVIKTNRKLNWL